MNASRVLLAAVSVLAISSYGAAFGSPDGLLSLDGSGYAATPDGLSPVSLDLNIVAGSTSDDAKLTVTSGKLVYGATEFEGTSMDGSFLRDAKFIRLSGVAERSDDSVAVNLLGRLVEKRGDESLYIVTGTLGSGGYEGKAVFAASLLRPVQTIETGPVEDDPLTVLLLPEPRNEGAPPGHLDKLSVKILAGQSVTITNKDTTPHRFVSGNLHEWVYERDGPPRVCDSEGKRDDAIVEKEVRTDTHLSGGSSFTFTVPEERDSKAPTANKPNPGCDFTRDGVTDITIEPGASASLSVSNLGFYRLLDVTSPWIQLEIVSLLEIR